MAVNLSSQCCSTREEVLLELDFQSSSWCEKYWRFGLGRDAACISQDVDGLKIDNKVFSSTPNDPSKGLLDNFKTNVLFHEPFYTKRHHELIFNSVVSAKQFYNESAPFPSAFAKRLRNIYADPRLAHAQISFIDPDNGIIAGYALTDQALFAIYGRLPVWDDICEWTNPGPRECEPCRAACDTVYNCHNFWEDCRYIQFKTHCTYRDFCRFVHFRRWCDYTETSGHRVDNWNEWSVFIGRYPIGEGLLESNWATWKCWNEWVEYSYFLRWINWEATERQWSAAGCGANGDCPVVGACPGTCARKALDRAKTKCFHTYNGCENCYEQPVETARTSEAYPYQFGAKRCCCCYERAAFMDLVEIQRRGACDPLCAAINLGVGIDACASEIKWYINQREVFKFVGIGQRMAERYSVRENGGYTEDIYPTRLLVNFGTGSLLDASLPNNYDRVRAKNDEVDMTALVPLQDNINESKTNYYELYHDKLGQMKPVNRNDTFAVVSNDPAFRLFGQGDVMIVRNLWVIQRRTFNDYRLPKTKCYAPWGTCDSKTGYCGDVTDCEEAAWCSDPDARDFIVTQVGTDGAGNPQFKLERRSDSKRFYEPTCNTSLGVNPYL